MKNNLRIAEDECSGKTDTMDYVKCRATKMEKEQGTPADKAFPTAWSIACKYKRDQLSDADEHCQKKPSEYFKSKKANGDSMSIPKRYLASDLEAEYEVMARFEKGKPADPTENMSEEDKKKWEEMKEKHGDKFKKAQSKDAGCENLPNEKMQQMCEDKKKDSKDDKEKEDKKANLSSLWESSPYLTRSAKENPMNKTAKMALRNLTASWGLTANEAYEMLAEEELAEYLAEVEALMADELEAGGNSGFEKYKSRKDNPDDWFIPNKTNKMRGGQGAGGKGDKNYLYYNYGEAPKDPKKYQKEYYQKRRDGEDIERTVCPDMQGTGKGSPCSKN